MITPEEIAAHQASLANWEARRAARAAAAATYRDAEPAAQEGNLAEAITAALADLPRVSDREASFRGSIAPRMAVSGFEARYQKDGLMNPASKDPRVIAQIEKLGLARAKLKGVGAIVALIGKRGTGKTTIAAEIVAERFWAAHAIASNPDNRDPVPCPVCRYIKLTDLVGKLKPLYADFGTTQTDKLEAFRDYLVGVDLLILDEWQEAGDDSKHKDKMTTDLIDRRYSAFRDTLIISNQEGPEFQRVSNPSLLSRIQEHGAIIGCNWASFRAPLP